MRPQRRRLGLATLLLALLLLPPAGGAVQPDEMLADPALEARAREISRNLRCLVCQNQSIDDSDAPLARDLRVLVRERLQAGDSNAAVYDFLTARYGDFVLLRPPIRPDTWALWFGPPALLAVGALCAFLYIRRRRPMPAEAQPLDAAERARLAALLGEGERPRDGAP